MRPLYAIPRMAGGDAARHRRAVQHDAPAGSIAAERRGHLRHMLWFPVQIDGDDLGVTVGVCKDISVKGLLVDTQARLAVGAPVKLTFRIATSQPLQEVDATIVRAGRATSGPWPYRIGLEFDEPRPELAHGLHVEARLQSGG